MHTLAYTLRQCRTSPGLFISASLLVALGIAANTLCLTIVNAIYFRPLPVRDPGSLVELFKILPGLPPQPDFTRSEYEWIKQNMLSTVSDVISENEMPVEVKHGVYPERAFAQGVPGDYFSFFGVPAFYGRVLDSKDTSSCVISYDYWSRSFGLDLSVVGKTIEIEDRAFRIIGITPKGFNGTTVDNGPDIRLLFQDGRDFLTIPGPAGVGFTNTEIIARLRPGFTNTQAQEELATVLRGFEHLQPDGRPLPPEGKGEQMANVRVEPISNGVSWFRKQFKPPFVTLFVGTCLLLLMVCSNVSALLLLHATSKRRAVAIRVAVGATARHIIKQRLSESFFVATLGGTVGLILVLLTVPILGHVIPPVRSATAGLREVSIDFYPNTFVLGCCGLLCVFVAVLCAIVPGWRTGSAPWNQLTVAGGGRPPQHRIQSVLCGIQICLCTVTIFISFLLFHSLRNLQSVNPGFDTERVITFAIDPHIRSYTDEQTETFQTLLINHLRLLPGVRRAALSSRALMQGIGPASNVVVLDGTLQRTSNASINGVSPGYFDTLRIPLLAGRDFREKELAAEHAGSLPVIVNRTFAKLMFGATYAIGRYFDSGNEYRRPKYLIIGEVGDSKYRSIREPPSPAFYVPDFAETRGRRFRPFVVSVRTDQEPTAIVNAVYALIHSLDPSMPIYRTVTLAGLVAESLQPDTILTDVALGFSLFGALLAISGMYSLLAQFVAQSTRDIGVRLALGATPRRLALEVGQQLVRIAGFGCVPGVLGGLASAAYLRTLLYEVGVVDAASVALTMVAVGLIVVIAAAIPVLRAMRMNPALALKYE